MNTPYQNPVPPLSFTKKDLPPEVSTSPSDDGRSRREAVASLTKCTLKLQVTFSMLGSLLGEFSLALAALTKALPPDAMESTFLPLPDVSTLKSNLAPNASAPFMPPSSFTPTESELRSTGVVSDAKPTDSKAGDVYALEGNHPILSYVNRKGDKLTISTLRDELIAKGYEVKIIPPPCPPCDWEDMPCNGSRCRKCGATCPF